MVHIERVDLAARGIVLPNDRVGMVVGQPFLSLTGAEPYLCTAVSKSKLIEDLASTLNVARAAPHGAQKTHFTILPEYSIPGLDGITLVENALNDAQWPAGPVII